MPTLPARLIRAALLLGILDLFANATQITTNRSAWLARVWQSDDGLPDNSVSGVAQTPDAFFWVATHGGLVRFDGTRFEELSPASIPGVPNRVVRALFRDRTGRLWLGMDRGPVVRVAPDSARVFTANDGLPDLQITGMAEDAEDAIWIGYARGDLFRITENQVTRFGTSDGLPTGGACLLASDPAGCLWIARDRQIGVFREQRFHPLLTVNDAATRIGSARKGGIWICSGRKWLRYDGGSGADQRGELPGGSGRIEPSVVFEDRTGTVWIGTGGQRVVSV